jgi:type II secretion system protein N
MRTRTKILLCFGLIVYGLVLFSALTFYRLPADKILTRTVEKVTEGKVLVSPGKLTSTLWKGHHLEDLSWTIQAGDKVVVERMAYLTLSLNFLRLLQGYVPLTLKGAMAKGTFQMSAGVSMILGPSKGYAKLQARGIQLGEIEALTLLVQRNIKGRLAARADVHGALNDPRKLEGQGTFWVEDGALDIKGDGFGIRNLPFSRITLPFSVGNGVVDLKGGEITSPLLGGKFDGQIRLHHDLQASPLQVKARLIPGLSSPDGQAGDLPLRGTRPILFDLQGTIGRPLISWTGAFP